ncbi:class I SAM-dependent methyltransferase [Myxacorys almedinensis A]|uniref:Class I SAM-dependent methyltransferase n=2 Tax=Myxacorys TaxID=2056239 RepID=A0A8J7Z205_9CYAN|nr:class I SAM-dependent methyltransferase [Myxacorys almedinensis A]
MITLYARSIETQREDAIVHDPQAVEMIERLDYDFSKYQKGWASQLGVSLRVRAIDNRVKHFIETHPKALNLGAGLCTRFSRVDNGEIRWYDVDFPEVIDLKQKLIAPTDRYRYIARSLFDFAWIDEIQREPQQPLLIILEGVAPYLTEAEVKSLLQAIRNRCTPATVIFDVLNQKSARNSKRHDTVSKTNAEFKWGIDRAQDIENWGIGMQLQAEEFYLNEFVNYPERLPLWARYIRSLLAQLFANSGRVLQVQMLS